MIAPFSNNAPPPIPGYGNPAGQNTGIAKTGQTTAYPSLPAFGTPSYNQGPYSGTNIGSLNSGFGGNALPANFLRELQDAFGKGGGSILDHIFTNGLFNPQIAAAFLNAQQPGINRGEADILGAFGNEGARFGSAASIGFGDYLSQVQLNQQQTLAQLFQQDQSEQLNLLGSVLPTLHLENVNRDSSSILSDILGVGEIAGGIIGAPFTGGASLGLVGSGVSTLTGGEGKGPDVKGAFGNLFGGKDIGLTPDQISTGFGGPTAAQPIPSDISNYPLSVNAGSVFGGADPFQSGNDENSLLQFLMSQGLLSPHDLIAQDGLGGN